MKILITGGAGFIGSHLVRHCVANPAHTVLTLDALTYAGHRVNLEDVLNAPNHHFCELDLREREAVHAAIAEFQPDWIAHLAAESHVDRSIDAPEAFLETNILGTSHLLTGALKHYQTSPPAAQARFRFLHVSTDEVFGALGESGQFTEQSSYAPRSPYAASKASSDHLVRAWGHTYGLPVLVTNCSNNYGPRQLPEKLIPLIILRALAGESLPVYGRGDQIRDWLHVEDHVSALLAVLEKGRCGETYLVGGEEESTNLNLVSMLCEILDELRPKLEASRYAEQITFVEDRPGHDFRYALDPSKIRRELGWAPVWPLRDGLRKTVEWFLENPSWVETVSAPSAVLARKGLIRPS